jgi:hypothetical protein
MHLQGQQEEAEIYLVANAALKSAAFALPRPDPRGPWRRVIDTAQEAGQASCATGEARPLSWQNSYLVQGLSVVVLVR